MNQNAILDSCFPMMVSKSAVPDGAELMNRVAGKPPEAKGPGRTGRPPKGPPDTEELAAELLNLRLQLNVDPKDPLKTALVLDEDDSQHWLIGSVLQVVMPDGSFQCVVLRDDVRVLPFG